MSYCTTRWLSTGLQYLGIVYSCSRSITFPHTSILHIWNADSIASYTIDPQFRYVKYDMNLWLSGTHRHKYVNALLFFRHKPDLPPRIRRTLFSWMRYCIIYYGKCRYASLRKTGIYNSREFVYIVGSHVFVLAKTRQLRLFLWPQKRLTYWSRLTKLPSCCLTTSQFPKIVEFMRSGQ